MTSPHGYGLSARFARGLASSPDRTAVHCAAGRLSYAELHETALRWAGAILDDAPEPPAAVGVLAAKGLDAYAGILAALYTGATVVPLHPDFPAARTGHMLTAAGVGAVVCDGAGAKALDAVRNGPEKLRAFRPETARSARPLDAPRPVRPEDIAYVLFTSGSTGQPKGVPIRHGSAVAYFDLLDRRYDFAAGDVFSQTFDLNFDCAMFDLFCAWGAGAAVQEVPAAAYRDLGPFLTDRGVSVWFSVPSSIALVRRLGGLPAGALPTLRWSFFAGEALRDADAADWHAAAPGSTIENLYGPTELTVTITRHRWHPDRSRGLAVNGLVPIGAVHDGHAYLLLDGDDRSVPDEGELCIAGPQLTGGYLDPRHDDGRFLERDGRRYYRTGDRVRRLRTGELMYLGRLDAQVQVQGWRVELAEVEHAVRAVPGIVDAVAVARTGEVGTELVVFYTGMPTPAAVLARHLRAVLPAGMLPREYRHIAELPLNPNRKTDRAALAREARSGRPG